MKITKSTLLGLFLLAILSMVSAALAQQSYTEDFTSTTYLDVVNTTADWNTTDGELKLFPFVPTLIGTCDTPGNPESISVSGDYAFVASFTSGLQVLDISDPANPVLIVAFPTPGSTADVTVSCDYAFVADGQAGFQVFDISDPANPVRVGSCNTPGNAEGVAVSGDYAFVTDNTFGLQVIDISDPTNPAIIANWTESGRPRDVAISGDHAFVATDYAGLKVVDISDPANPILAGTCDTPGTALDVTVSGNLAFVADYTSGLQVIDISDPTNPTLLGTCDTPGVGWGVTVSGDYAFIADGLPGLQMIDISDPANPSILGTCATQYAAMSVAIAGNHAFVADYDSGLQVIEIAEPTNPTLMSNLDTLGLIRDVAVSGDHAFVADEVIGLRIIDISDPMNPTVIGTCDTPGQGRGVTVSGDHAFVAAYTSGLAVIDISDLTNATLIGEYSWGGMARDVTVAGDYAFVAAQYAGLQVIDISDPTNPTLAGNYNTPGEARGVFVSGDYAYVADYDSGLQVIDISDPTNPTLLGSYDTPGLAFDVTVAVGCAFVADNWRGLQVLDISDPTNPTLLGNCDTQSYANGISISGDYVFVADNETGLQVIDVADPANPVLIGYHDTSSYANGVAVSGDCVYLSDWSGGLYVFMVFQGGFHPDANLGRSLLVDDSSDAILSTRLTTTQTDSIAWEVSNDSGLSWQEIAPDASWNRMAASGTDLMWRSTFTITAPSINPTVSNLTLEWLNEFAPINSVTDVPDDQGGLVDVTISRSAYDFVDEVSQPVTGYNIYRRVDGGSVSAKALDTTPVRNGQTLLTPSGQEAWPLPDETVVSINGEFHVLGSANPDKAASFPSGTWKLVSTAFATQSDSYIVEATTAADSTTAGIDWSVYLVTTHTATPSVWFISLPDSGYSVDNIAPGVPKAVTAGYQASGVTLDWDDALETDFQYYRVYRGADPGFIPSGDNLVQEVATSAWTDPAADPWGYHYKVTTLDNAGNESEAGAPSSVSGSRAGGVPARTTLLGAVPNPFNPSTRLSFEMAAAGHARLTVYDIAGRRVATLVDEQREAGRHGVNWEGRDGTGRLLASGVYFYRFEAGDYRETKSMVLMK